MRKKDDISFFEEIIAEIDQNIDELLQFWNVYDRQMFFVSAISIYDKLFLNRLSDENSRKDFANRIMEFGYPVFIRRFYSDEFSQLPGISHKALDLEHLELYTRLLYSCGILGWMQNFIDNVQAGFYSSTKFLNYIRVKFVDKYHWNEYLEGQYSAWYSSFVSSFQKAEYEKLDQELPEILNKLRQNVFVWKNEFMGYTNDLDTELYFQRHARLDAQQSTEWDWFPDDSKFGSIYYGDIVETIVEFSGYSIKHVYCARTLQQKYPELLTENLLQNIIMEEDLIKLISANRSISLGHAESILRLLALSPNEITYYNNGKAHSAPLVKVSQSQYVRSIKGFLSEPFGFMLFNLRSQYKSDWDKNTKLREVMFREQLYTIFGAKNFCCISHPVIIKKKGKTITDIDAVIVDKSNGEIGLFQLKWQDPTDYSPFALRSKRSNYNSKTAEWIVAVEQWIAETTEKEIAALLGVPVKYIDKQNVCLFVLGRKHGNYSGGQAPTQKCSWGQWYQLLLLTKELLARNQLTLSRMYSLLEQNDPFKRKVSEPVNVFSYGKYRIVLGGNVRGIIREFLWRFRLAYRENKD